MSPPKKQFENKILDETLKQIALNICKYLINRFLILENSSKLARAEIFQDIPCQISISLLGQQEANYFKIY